MACQPTPAATALLAEADRLWPQRSRQTDGICPSPAHSAANPNSDHEWGGAVDLTKDVAAGVDTGALADMLRQRAKAGAETRIAYVIADGRIASSREDWNWRPYTGRNPHTSHMHVSFTRDGAQDGATPFFGKGIKDPAATTSSDGAGGPAVPLAFGLPGFGVGLPDVSGLINLATTLADPDTWKRVLGVALGLVLIILGVVMLAGDLIQRRAPKIARELVSARTGGAIDLPVPDTGPAPIAAPTNAGRP